jgi:hypothetical protein
MEILGFSHISLADYGVVFAYRGVAIAAEPVLLCQQARVDGSILIIVPGYDKHARQSSGMRFAGCK